MKKQEKINRDEKFQISDPCNYFIQFSKNISWEKFWQINQLFTDITDSSAPVKLPDIFCENLTDFTDNIELLKP